MNFQVRVALAGLMLALSTPVLAAETVTEAVSVTETAAPATVAAPTTAAAPATAAPVRIRKRSPLSLAIAAAIETEQLAMATLEARLAATRDPLAVAQVQREIEQLKLDTEVQVLTLQATHHRDNGRPAAAEQLEAVIRDLKSPPRAFAPISRPAPTGAGQ